MRDAWMEVLPPPMDRYSFRDTWFLGAGAAVARGWTPEENKQFEKELAGLDLCAPDWAKVARAIPGKTVDDVMNHYTDLELDVRQIESGLVPFPVYNGGAPGVPSFALQWEANGGAGYHVGGGCGKRHVARTPEQERKKGVPWTEEEHKLFLMGLKKHGKGDWRNISRNFVQTRTPTQVASHAQKYFIRLNSGGKDKRRSSIHDITTVNLTDDAPPSPSQSPLLGSQSNASAQSAAAGQQFSLTVDAKQHVTANMPFNSPARTFGMPAAYGMSLQDQGLQCGPLHDSTVGNQSMLF